MVDFEGKNENWLDVGCGTDKISGAIGVDLIKLPGVDVVHNLNVFPWPFEDNTFDHIVCNQSLSHLNDFVGVIEQMHRIAKPGGIVEILAPHYANDSFNTDPTHKMHIGIRSMNYFLEGIDFKYRYYSSVRFEKIVTRISFRENRTDFRNKIEPNPTRWLGIEQLVNYFPRIYERFFVYWMPPAEVYFKLRVLKGSLQD